MTRRSKQSRDRSVSFRRPRPPSEKTGRREEAPFKEHANALGKTDFANLMFIPIIK